MLDQAWPEADSQALIKDEIELVVQVNGKLRGQIRVAKDASHASIEHAALGHEPIQRSIANRPVKRIVVVPGKLVNIVI